MSFFKQLYKNNNKMFYFTSNGKCYKKIKGKIFALLHEKLKSKSHAIILSLNLQG